MRNTIRGTTKATHEGDTTGGSPSESKQTESEREEGELGVRSTSLTGSSGSLSESEGRPKPEVRRRLLGGRERWYGSRKGCNEDVMLTDALGMATAIVVDRSASRCV